MNHKMTLTVIAVESDTFEEMYCHVMYGSSNVESPKHELRTHVALPDDPADCADWARQALAAIIEAL